MKIRNVVFDIGNVLADYRWYGFLQDKGFSPEMIDRIARCSTLLPAWNEFDRGVLSSEEVVEGFIRLDPEIADELHRAFDDLSDLLRMFPYSVPWIEKLKTAQKGTDLAAIKAATEEVQKAFYAVSEKLYKNAAPQGEANAAPNAGAGQQAGGNDDGGVDADYEEGKDN